MNTGTRIVIKAGKTPEWIPHPRDPQRKVFRAREVRRSSRKRRLFLAAIPAAFVFSIAFMGLLRPEPEEGASFHAVTGPKLPRASRRGPPPDSVLVEAGKRAKAGDKYYAERHIDPTRRLNAMSSYEQVLQMLAIYGMRPPLYGKTLRQYHQVDSENDSIVKALYAKSRVEMEKENYALAFHYLPRILRIWPAHKPQYVAIKNQRETVGALIREED